MRKSEFLTPLFVEQMPNEIDWLVTTPFLYYSAVLERELAVPAGFVTDFASVPRLPVVYLMTGGVAVRPAVIHDYLYRGQIVPRRQADAVFEEAMELTGHPWWRRRLMWLGVRVFGGKPYNDATRRNPISSGEGNTTALNLDKVPPAPSPRAIAAAEDPTAKHEEIK